MTPRRYQCFGPTDAARLAGVQFSPARLAEGTVTGRHRSPHRGFSVEFSEYREYVAGDELRFLDWRVYARSDRHFVKLFEQETNLRAVLVLDSSASMGYQGKFDYARRLCAGLAYIMVRQQDGVGLLIADDEVRAKLPPGNTNTHLDRLFVALDGAKLGGSTGLAPHLHALAEELPRRSVVILVSDLWTDTQAIADAMQHLHFRKHQCLVLHLVSPEERDLDLPEQVTLEDPETHEKLPVTPADIREVYLKNLGEFQSAVRSMCAASRSLLFDVNTESPSERVLLSLVGRAGGRRA